MDLHFEVSSQTLSALLEKPTTSQLQKLLKSKPLIIPSMSELITILLLYFSVSTNGLIVVRKYLKNRFYYRNIHRISKLFKNGIGCAH